MKFRRLRAKADDPTLVVGNVAEGPQALEHTVETQGGVDFVRVDEHWTNGLFCVFDLWLLSHSWRRPDALPAIAGWAAGLTIDALASSARI